MNLIYIRLFIIFQFIALGLTSLSQPENQPENSDESKIISNWKIINYKHKEVPIVKIKQRRFVSPLFANEFIPFRGGIIINSITSSRGEGKYDINTAFYYIDTATQILFKLIVPGIDTIESITTDRYNHLYYSCKKNAKQFIYSYNGEQPENLLSVLDSISNLLNTSAWIKLGYYKDTLYALSPNGVFKYNSIKWEQVTKISVGNDDLSRRKYRWSYALLPSLNIRITDDAVWFVREVLQGRNCNLLRLDLKTGETSELFNELGYTDRTKKEVYSFSILPDQSLLITATRLMYNYLTFKTDGKKTEVWVFKNSIKTDSGKLEPFPVTNIIYKNDTAYLLSVNGIFMKNATISPMLFWENGHQQIKFSLGVLDYEFIPRSAEFISNNKLLIGGIWGGIYLVDLVNNRITCLDDIKNERKMNISSLYKRH